MTWVFGGLAGLLAAVVLLLAIPVRFSMRIEKADRTRVRWRLRWLFGLVDVRSAGRTGEAEVEERPPEAAAPARSRKTRRRRFRQSAALEVLRTEGLLRRVQRLVFALLLAIRWEDLSASVRFGFEDPADTGLWYGALAPVLVAGRVRGWPVSCQPVFDDACVEGVCSLAARLRPISIVRIALGLLVSREVFRAIRAWRSSR